MAQIQIDDRILEVAKQRAADGGYASVEEYIADVVEQDGLEDASAVGSQDFQKMFTPEFLAEIDKADAEIDAGNFFTSEQVELHFKNNREHRQGQSGQP